nr:uncharacterized protein LOC106683772 isoform X1 [Halyomorpha halys]
MDEIDMIDTFIFIKEEKTDEVEEEKSDEEESINDTFIFIKEEKTDDVEEDSMSNPGVYIEEEKTDEIEARIPTIFIKQEDESQFYYGFKMNGPPSQMEGLPPYSFLTRFPIRGGYLEEVTLGCVLSLTLVYSVVVNVVCCNLCKCMSVSVLFPQLG